MHQISAALTKDFDAGLLYNNDWSLIAGRVFDLSLNYVACAASDTTVRLHQDQ